MAELNECRANRGMLPVSNNLAGEFLCKIEELSAADVNSVPL